MVRKALNYAIDRKKIAELAYQGKTEPVCQPFPSNHWAFNQALASAHSILQRPRPC